MTTKKPSPRSLFILNIPESGILIIPSKSVSCGILPHLCLDNFILSTCSHVKTLLSFLWYTLSFFFPHILYLANLFGCTYRIYPESDHLSPFQGYPSVPGHHCPPPGLWTSSWLFSLLLTFLYFRQLSTWQPELFCQKISQIIAFISRKEFHGFPWIASHLRVKARFFCDVLDLDILLTSSFATSTLLHPILLYCLPCCPLNM